MNSLLILLLVISTICYFYFLKQKNHFREAEDILELLDNRPNHSFFKVNTKSNRKFEILDIEGQFLIKIEIKSIEIVEENLLLTMRGENDLFGLQLLIRPFIKELFKVEDYRHFHQEGIVCFSGFGFETLSSVKKMVETHFENFDLQNEASFEFVQKFTGVTIDPIDEQYVFEGKFPNGNDFKITFRQKNFELEMEANIADLGLKSNFKLENPFE